MKEFGEYYTHDGNAWNYYTHDRAPLSTILRIPVVLPLGRGPLGAVARKAQLAETVVETDENKVLTGEESQRTQSTSGARFPRRPEWN